MPRKSLPRIVAVSAGEKPFTLQIVWDEGDESVVDVSGLMETFRVYETVRHSPRLFSEVRLGDEGTDIVWSDGVDMSAHTLWRVGREQTGATLSPDASKS